MLTQAPILTQHPQIRRPHIQRIVGV